MGMLIELKDVSEFRISESGVKKPLINNISLSIQVEPRKIYRVECSSDTERTSLLKIIAGLDTPDSGSVLVNGSNRNSYFPFIPKSPSSFQWMTVEENIKSVPGITIDVKRIIDGAGLDGYEDFIPHRKSKGFRFRISLARALASSAQLIILDDCFSEMDPETSGELDSLLKSTLEEFNTSYLFGTISTNLLNEGEDVTILRGANAG